MNREQLEHAIRASGDLLNEDEVIVVGSQSILGAFPEGLPSSVLLSIEIDIMMRDDPQDEKQQLVNGQQGELTMFHSTHGFFVEAVGEDLCRFPSGWRGRVVEVNTPGTNGVTGLCPDPHDLAIAKLLACREKDVTYVAALLKSGHLQASALVERAQITSMNDYERELVLGVIDIAGKPGRRNTSRHEVRAFRRLLESNRNKAQPPGP